jgi:hypothetical protein
MLLQSFDGFIMKDWFLLSPVIQSQCIFHNNYFSTIMLVMVTDHVKIGFLLLVPNVALAQMTI